MSSILIVEDEAVVADDMQETLRSLGYTVMGTAKSGETALEKLSATLPDIVLMDINLAGTMDGIETAGRIHDLYRTPVVFVTAYADKALLDRAKVTEPYGYVLKPYDERGLQSAIEMALYKYRMEHRLRQSEETIRLMMNATQDFLYLVSADGKFLLANDAFAEHTGMDPDELHGTTAYDLVSQNLLTPVMACWQLTVRGEKSLAFEEQLDHNWYDVIIYPVYNDQGIAEKFAVSIRNRSARKQAEDLAKKNAESFRLLIEDASEIMVMLNIDGTFSQESPSFKEALGYPPNENLKKSLFDHISISDYQQAKQVLSEILVHPGMAKPIRLKFERLDGTVVIIKGIMSNLSDNPFVGNIVLNGWVE
ncbi:MAG: response regulator [Methanoregula sp.]|jgi:PAS domain S-box-containing protein|nr:response regulator [Methanoregula sp.]